VARQRPTFRITGGRHAALRPSALSSWQLHGLLSVRDGPDPIAAFAIRPGRTDIGGYGGSSPGEQPGERNGGAQSRSVPALPLPADTRGTRLFVGADGPDTIAAFAIRPGRTDIGGYGGSSPREKTVWAEWRSTVRSEDSLAARRGGATFHIGDETPRQFFCAGHQLPSSG
jgi:hypothetical protein